MAVHPPVAKFPEVDHADASGELAEIYDDIEFTLRAPWVPFAVRVMSLFPAFVPAAWQALKPQISTVYAEKGADLVREASIIPGPLPPDRRPRLRAAGRSEEEISKIREALDSLNYGNPKGLILITAWNEAWNERAAGCPANSLSAAQARPLPGGLPAALGRFPGDQASSVGTRTVPRAAISAASSGEMANPCSIESTPAVTASQVPLRVWAWAATRTPCRCASSTSAAISSADQTSGPSR
jgi:hypothetical protein